LCNDDLHCADFDDKRVDWSSFKQWLNKEYKPKTIYDILYYLKRYSHCLLDKDFKPLLELTKDKRLHCMAALSALSKFLGIHEQFSTLVKNYGLKWSVRGDDLIIARFSKSVDPNAVFDWIKKVKQSCSVLRDFMNFMAITGLRFDEAINSYNLIIKLAKEGKLVEYYNGERELLEHYKFKEIFLCRTKKAFMSFVPKDFIERVRDNKPLNAYSIQTRVKRKTKQLRFGDIREVHGTLMTRYLSEVEINFLHGRVSSSVFMTNYFNLTWISDLKDRTFKSVRAIMQRIN
jgi:intergrase/recombinase